MQDVTCKAELEIEMSALLWNLLVYTKTCPASSPHYQVNGIEWENCRNCLERKKQLLRLVVATSQKHNVTYLWKKWRYSKRKLSQMQGHAGEARFILDLQGWGAIHGISCWYLDQSFLHSPGADSPGPEFGITGNKGHFTPSSGVISPRSLFKQHNTSAVTNLTEIPFQYFERVLVFFLFQQEKPTQAFVQDCAMVPV